MPEISPTLIDAAKLINMAPDMGTGGGGILPKKEILPVTTIMEKMDPNNHEHASVAIPFDIKSAADGETNEKGVATVLDPDEHWRWTHPGEHREGEVNPWLGLSLVRDVSSGKLVGFSNETTLEPIHVQALTESGLIKPDQHGVEVNAWLMEGSKRKKAEVLGRDAEEQLGKAGIDFVTYWSSPREESMLKRLGFRKAYTGPYVPGDAEPSDCYIRSKSESGMEGLQQIANINTGNDAVTDAAV
jgi:hypothetical protein